MALGPGSFGSEDPSERKFRKYSDSELVRALVSYILVYKKQFAIVLSTLLLAAAFGVIGPAVVGWAINDIVPIPNFGGLILMMAIFTGINVANYFSSSVQTRYMQLLGQNVIYDVRKDAFEKLQQLSPSYYSRRETGRIMSYITNDVDALSDFVTFQLPQVLAGLVTIISIVIIMFAYNVTLTLISLVVVPPLVVLTYALQRRIQLSFVETRKKIAIVTSKLQEGISGVRVTQSLAKEEKVNENFDFANSQNLQANLHANKLTSTFNAVVGVIESGGIALVLWYGALEVLGGSITVGLLFTFLLYVNSFFSPIIQLTTFYNSYQAAVTGLDRVMQVLNHDIEVREAPIAHTQSPRGAAGVEIEFQQVTFGYDPTLPVLWDLSFKVERNHVLAIVGPTGAGKSSIVSLILRFYDTQTGAVKIDGMDVRGMSFQELRGIISLIPQEPFLFSTSIMNNIRYGKQAASDEEVIAVAKQVGVHDFVMALPEGYDTLVAEGATNLSMGQKQLICFARAFLPNPKLLIMDEATSGVDPFTELQLQKALATMLEGRSSIIIAHRLSTIRLADHIIVLKEGKIAEEGTFSELNQQKEGSFARMYAMQTGLDS